MKFDQDFIEKVREASNLVNIIGQFVQLKRSSNGYVGLCPFHNEKSPSFSVSEEKQVYHCFGCKESGTVYTFMQKNQGMTFPESVEYLARAAGIAIPEGTQSGANHRDQKNVLFKVNGLAVDFYHQELMRLPADHPAQKYLQMRGLTKELVAEFKLGYAPDAWSELSLYFESKRVPASAAEEVGLIKRRKDDKSGHFDLFRNRLMFPIFSPLNQCIGFGGRNLGNELPKYINSTDSLAFHKGKVFYGLNHSAKYIRAEDFIIVVEGYMDWLALVKAGIHNVVATLGTALTHDHAKLLKRYTPRVVVLFDGDTAGRTAAERSLPILLGEGLLPRGLFLPDNLDPDDFLTKNSVTDLKKLIDASPDLFDLIATDLAKTAKLSATSKVQALDQLAPILARAQDSRLRQLYSQNLAEQLRLDVKVVEQSVRAALQKAAGGTVAQSKPTDTFQGSSPVTNQPVPQPLQQPPAQIELKGAPVQEIDLLNVSLMKEVYLKEVLAANIFGQLAHPGVRRAFARIVEVYGQMPSKFDNLTALLADEVRPFEMMTRHLSEPLVGLTDEAAKKLIHDCVKRVREKFLRAQSKELVSNLRGSQQDGEQASQLEQIMNIEKSRRSLSRD